MIMRGMVHCAYGEDGDDNGD